MNLNDSSALRLYYYIHFQVAFSIICVLTVWNEKVNGQEMPEFDIPEAPVRETDAPTSLDAGINKFLMISRVLSSKKYLVDGKELSGKGLTVAVIDSGLNKFHNDFAGDRIPIGRNFIKDDNPADYLDRYGHGSWVTSILAANKDENWGIAPQVKIIPLKVLEHHKSTGDWGAVIRAMKWVLCNHEQYNITAVNISIGDFSAHTSDKTFSKPDYIKIQELVRKLVNKRIAIIAAAGNSYHEAAHRDKQNMQFPAICREVISVGAMYYGNPGDWFLLNGKTGVRFQDDSVAYYFASFRCPPFTQRLKDKDCQTTIFAPGYSITGAGKVVRRNKPASQTSQWIMKHGTSSSAPLITGIVILMQQWYLHKHGKLPTVEELKGALLRGGRTFQDKEDQDGIDMDNVTSSGEAFLYADAWESFKCLEDPKYGPVSSRRLPNLLTWEQKEASRLYSYAATSAALSLEDPTAEVEGVLAERISTSLGERKVFFHTVNEQQTELALKIRSHLSNPQKIDESEYLQNRPIPIGAIEIRYGSANDAIAALNIGRLVQEQEETGNTLIRPVFTGNLKDGATRAGEVEIWFPEQMKVN